jgi:RNA polymerase sigma factor (TIGR02999 family)
LIRAGQIGLMKGDGNSAGSAASPAGVDGLDGLASPPIRPRRDVTQLLQGASGGDPRAAAELLPLVYEELRQLAARRLAGERQGHTLQPPALVHEAWLRVSGQDERAWQGRQHFFAAAAEAMRRILVDHARRRRAAKRGAGAGCLDVEEFEIPAPAPDDQLLAVHEAVARFETVDARKAELVKLRFFAGLRFEEAAEVLGIAVPTAKQWWTYSRAWLGVEIAGSGAPCSSRDG